MYYALSQRVSHFEVDGSQISLYSKVFIIRFLCIPINVVYYNGLFTTWFLLRGFGREVSHGPLWALGICLFVVSAYSPSILVGGLGFSLARAFILFRLVFEVGPFFIDVLDTDLI